MEDYKKRNGGLRTAEIDGQIVMGVLRQTKLVDSPKTGKIFDKK